MFAVSILPHATTSFAHGINIIRSCILGGVTTIDSIVTAAAAGQNFDRLFSAVWTLTTLILGHWPLTARIFCPKRSLDIWTATKVREPVCLEISVPRKCNPTARFGANCSTNLVRSALGFERWPTPLWPLTALIWMVWPLTECGRSCDYRVYGSDTPLQVLTFKMPFLQNNPFLY